MHYTGMPIFWHPWWFRLSKAITVPQFLWRTQTIAVLRHNPVVSESWGIATALLSECIAWAPGYGRASKGSVAESVRNSFAAFIEAGPYGKSKMLKNKVK